MSELADKERRAIKILRMYKGDDPIEVSYSGGKDSDGDWELSTPPVCRVDIKYVHQLQHALRLAGVDEEINL